MDVNKLYHTDCLNLMKEMPDESIDMILTDPPYGINFTPQRKGSKERLGDNPVLNDEIQDDKWLEWFTPICQELYRVLKNDSVAYMFSGYIVDRHYYSVMEACGFEIKAVMIWVKNNFGLGYHFRRQYEKIVVGFKGKPPTPEKAISDVIFDAKVNGVDLVHSCQKPLPMLGVLLRQYTKDDDLIFDPFAGSGSHLMAALKNGRRWIGSELDEKHFKKAEERLRIESSQLKLF